MDGIDYFRDYCQKNGADPDIFFKIGRGTRGPTRDKRYKLTLEPSTFKDTQIYAIQYCKDIDVYIAWRLKRARHFSLKADDILLPLGDRVCSVKKFVEYSGWGEELALYFSQKGIPDFLKRYVPNQENKEL